MLSILVLGLGACSSSSKQATPTTNSPASTTTVTAPTIKGKLGPCPAVFPRVQLATLNAGIPSLDTTLLPLDAISARVCMYTLKGLVASGTVPAGAVKKLVADTNALTKLPGPLTCANQQISGLMFLSFDSQTQRMHLGESNGCGGGVANGTLVASETKAWTAEVKGFATTKATPPAVTTPK